MIDVREDHLKIVLDILNKFVPSCEVKVFGSRYKWTAKDYSDLDLAIVDKEKINWKLLADIKEAFQESEFPYRVDVLDWNRISEEFKKVIETSGYEVLKKTAHNNLYREINFGDLFEITMGQSPPGNTCSKNNEGLPLLNGPTEFGITYPTAVQWTTCITKQSKVGDILFCVRGSTTGRMNWSNREYVIGRGLAAIRSKKDPALNFLGKELLENELPSLLQGATGSTFPNVSKDLLTKLKVKVPKNIKDCLYISYFIRSLVKKIELNNQINQTLESMAKAIFKEWFIDFGPVKAKAEGKKPYGMDDETAALFPDCFEESELGLIPKGWRVGKLEELADVIGGGTPSTSEANNFCQPNTGISWLSPKDLSGYSWKYISHGAIDITEDGLKNSSARMLPSGTVLFSSRAPIGYIAISENALCTNQGFKSLVPKNASNTEFLYYLMKSNVNFIESRASGSTFKEISGNEMKLLPVIQPPVKLIEKFKNNVFTYSMFQKKLKHKTNSLIQTRDLLLPKLISGEIQLNDLPPIL